MEPYNKFKFTRPDFPLEIISMDTQPPTELHEHDFEELTIICKGRGMHLYKGKEYPITPGDVYTIKPGMKHGYPQTEDLVLINILFISSQLKLEVEDLDDINGYHVLFDLEPKYRSETGFQSRLKLSPVQLAKLVSMAEELRNELWNPKPGYKFMAMTDLRRIVGYLSRCYSEISNKNVHSLITISKAIKHMEKNFTEKLSIPELASIASVSESTLLRAFKKNTDMSPNAYFIQLKIQYACEKLRQTNATISEIAFDTGYNDSNYFTRQFHQQMGKTPGEYRKDY